MRRVLERSPVLPVRFATIFASRERVSRLLAAHHDAISAFLDRTTGMEEWGVKVYLDRDTTMRRLIDESRAAADPSVSPGRRYMEERRIRAEADARLQRWLDETCAGLRETLSQCAPESVERHVFAAETAGEMVANWAFLVAREDVEHLRAAVSEASAPLEPWGLALECAGPFPPYKEGKVAFAANASAVIVRAGAAASNSYKGGTQVYVGPHGGMLLEAAIGGQKFVYRSAALTRGKALRTDGPPPPA